MASTLASNSWFVLKKMRTVKMFEDEMFEGEVLMGCVVDRDERRWVVGSSKSCCVEVVLVLLCDELVCD